MCWWNLLREPALKLTMLKLKLSDSAGSTIN